MELFENVVFLCTAAFKIITGLCSDGNKQALNQKINPVVIHHFLLSS